MGGTYGNIEKFQLILRKYQILSVKLQITEVKRANKILQIATYYIVSV